MSGDLDDMGELPEQATSKAARQNNTLVFSKDGPPFHKLTHHRL
jgi:hypothetical protein